MSEQLWINYQRSLLFWIKRYTLWFIILDGGWFLVEWAQLLQVTKFRCTIKIALFFHNYLYCMSKFDLKINLVTFKCIHHFEFHPTFFTNHLLLPRVTFKFLWLMYLPESGKDKTTWLSICSLWCLLRWAIPSVHWMCHLKCFIVSPRHGTIWTFSEAWIPSQFWNSFHLHDLWQFLFNLLCLSQGKRKCGFILIICWWCDSWWDASPVFHQKLPYVWFILLPASFGVGEQLRIWSHQYSIIFLRKLLH